MKAIYPKFYPYLPDEEQSLMVFRHRYQNEPNTTAIASEYRAALENQLSVNAVAAQEELIRRGEIGIVSEAIADASKNGYLQFSTALSERIGSSLAAGMDGFLDLKAFGEFVMRRNAAGETGPIPLRDFSDNFRH